MDEKFIKMLDDHLKSAFDTRTNYSPVTNAKLAGSCAGIVCAGYRSHQINANEFLALHHSCWTMFDRDPGELKFIF